MKVYQYSRRKPNYLFTVTGNVTIRHFTV